jgi:radical SAM protein (TIGR01212 family)
LKRYRDLNSYLREIHGERVQKISLDTGLNCPNRDGTLSRKGCIFCDNRGSGTGAMIHQGLSIEEQLLRGCRFAEKRYGAKKFIAYFQSFTNTYGPLPRLKALYDRALNHPGMVGLSVATRPDCVNHEVLALLQTYRRDHMVWIEVGLQSAHDQTLSLINRGHDVACFKRTVLMAQEYGLDVCAHVILGLPGESRDMMLATAHFLAGLPIQGIKIHLLYVPERTALAALYDRGLFHCLEMDEYVALVVDFLECLSPDTVIHRLTGDPIRSELKAPMWALRKTETLKRIKETLKQRDAWQGKRCRVSTS